MARATAPAPTPSLLARSSPVGWMAFRTAPSAAPVACAAFAAAVAALVNPAAAPIAAPRVSSCRTGRAANSRPRVTFASRVQTFVEALQCLGVTCLALLGAPGCGVFDDEGPWGFVETRTF